MGQSWSTEVTFTDGETERFRLAEEEATAREMFRESRRDYERARRDPIATKGHVFLEGVGFFDASDILHLELTGPEDTGSP